MDMRVTSTAPGLKIPSEDNPTSSMLSFADALDTQVLRVLASKTHGASPLALATAGFDWLSHFWLLPGRQLQFFKGLMTLPVYGVQNVLKWWETPADETMMLPPIEASIRYVEGVFDGVENLIDRTSHNVPGVSKAHTDLVRFASHQAAEVLRPENYLWFNREALRKTTDEQGQNLLRGWQHFLTDTARQTGLIGEVETKTSEYVVGDTIARASGKVVYRNRLIELIQYTPTTEKVHPEPILIIPAWIMKYYILDLSAKNSMVQYLVDQGFTVFMISWKNPDAEDADLELDDYRRLGVLAAMDAVTANVPDQKIHLAGYCLGGTLLTITEAALARDGDDRAASMTLFAAQTDFRDAGELKMFIDEDQLTALEASMQSTGYLDGGQMASAFAMLRSRDLIWRRLQRAYLLGERDPEFDLMIWNEDTTRMPPKMHSQYLRELYLNNALVNGTFCVEGHPIAISDIRVPIFALGTEKDHVAPWRSVFKIHLFADTEVTFVLTNGGHNAGVISEPGRQHRRHRVLTRKDAEPYIPPADWMARAEQRDGSWWPTWVEWLDAQSGAQIEPPKLKRAAVEGNDIAARGKLPDAPGDYVRL